MSMGVSVGNDEEAGDGRRTEDYGVPRDEHEQRDQRAHHHRLHTSTRHSTQYMHKTGSVVRLTASTILCSTRTCRMSAALPSSRYDTTGTTLWNT